MNKRIKSLLLCLVMAFTLVAAAAPALAASAEPAPAAEAAPTDGDIEFTPVGPGSDTNSTGFTIPFTKTVVKGGDVEPGETSFELEIVAQQNTTLKNYTVSSLVSTKGAGTFNGSLTVYGTDAAALVTTGFYVREQSLGDEYWNCDTTVYFVVLDDQNTTTTFKYFEATSDGNGGYTTTNNSEPAESLTFTNTYTERNKTVEIPFTKTVKLGGDVAPGAQDFELEILKFVDENGKSYYPGVSYTATVSTNGAGDYEGKLVITGPENAVNNLVAEEFFVREKNTGADKWTYDDAVWCVKGEPDDNGEVTSTFYPTTLNDNGGYEPDYDAGKAAKMTFENTYTENKPVPTATPKPAAPKTGDESALALWLTLLLGGTAATGIVIGTRKKTER